MKIEAPVLTEDLLDQGKYVLASIDGWPTWAHRKVESLNLLDGQRDRRRVSIDCTPLDPADLGIDTNRKPQGTASIDTPKSVNFSWKSFSISFASRTSNPREVLDAAAAEHLSKTEEPLIVPLTFMEKRTHKTFDLRDAEGRALTLLHSEDNAVFAAAAIAYVLVFSGNRENVYQNWAKIYRIAAESRTIAEIYARDLIEEMDISPYPRALLMDIARNFILFAQLPSTAAGNRQVLKFAYHWEAETKRLSLLRRFRTLRGTWSKLKANSNPVTASFCCGQIIRKGLVRKARRLRHHVWAGLGFGSVVVKVNINSLSSTRSYHLECPAPDGLLCSRVELPPTGSGTNVDRSVSEVGHAHGIYGFLPKEKLRQTPPVARVYFILDRTKLLPRVIWSGIAVSTLFGLLLLIPDAIPALTDQEDSATALFLFIPALLVALNARGPENFLTAKVLLFLRLMAFGLSLLLVFAGGFVVLAPQPGPHQDTIRFEYWMTCYWLFAFIMSAVMTIILLLGYFNLSVRGRQFHDKEQ